MKTLRFLFVVVLLPLAHNSFGQTTPAATNLPTATLSATNQPALAPTILPGNGLAQHPFLYTGEWDYRKTNQTIFVVRGGKVVWTYDIPINDANGTLEELGDATIAAGKLMHPGIYIQLGPDDVEGPCRFVFDDGLGPTILFIVVVVESLDNDVF